MGQLLETKVRTPSVRDGFVARDGVARLIDDAVARPGGSVLVCAPFGYGKTTACACWAQMRRGEGLLVAWLSLDEYDNQDQAFFTYLRAAVNQVVPGALPEFDSLVCFAERDIRVLASLFLDGVRALGREVVLCLDDFQEMTDPLVLRFVELLVSNADENVHFIVIGRAVPAFLAGPMMAVDGRFTVIDQGILRFADHELRAFCDGMGRSDIDDASLGRMSERTEGWPLAVRLEALEAAFGRGDSDVPRLVLAGRGPVSKVLFSDLFRSMAADTREFLHLVASFDYFSLSLVRAVAPQRSSLASNARKLLDRLIDDNVFIMSIGEEYGETWYRFHSLFREELRRQSADAMAPKDVERLHKAAATWFGDRENYSRMMKHALASGDPAFAAVSLERACHALSPDSPVANSFDLNRWIAAIPEAALDAHPKIRVAHALNLALTDFAANRAFVERAIKRLEEGCSEALAGESDDLPGQINLLKLVYAVSTGELGGICPDSRIAIETDSIFADQSLYGGRLHQMLAYVAIGYGDVEGALRELDVSMGLARQNDASVLQVLVAGNQVDVLVRMGRLDEAEALCLRVVEEGHGPGCSRALNTLVMERARIRACRGDFENALALLEQLGRETNTSVYCNLMCGLLSLFIGLNTERPSLIDDALKPVAHLRGADELMREAGLLADSLRQGGRFHVERARPIPSYANWDSAAPGDLAVDLTIRQGASLLRAIRYLMAGGEESVGHALKFFAEEIERASSRGFSYSLVAPYAYTALGLCERKDKDGAEHALALAMEHAAKASRLDAFMLPYPRIRELLCGVASKNVHLREQIERVEELHCAYMSPDGRAEKRTLYDLILTKRETEVLSLAAQGLSNREIADRLVLSVTTVKTHMYSTCQKLEACNRTEAVFRAHELGIISVL